VEKQLQHNMKYKSISKQEAFLLSLVEGSGLIVFGVRDLAKLSNWPRPRLHNTLASLLKKDIITRIKRGSFSLTKHLSGSAFAIATETVKPSYISFWTALSHLGFTEQQIMQVQLVSPKQSRRIWIGEIEVEVVALKPYRFFGYERKEGFVIAEPEKALIDSLFRMEMSGGMDEVAKCLMYAWPSLNHRRFKNYVLRFRNKSLVSRAGYMIERLGLGMEGLDGLVSASSRSYVPLDPSLKGVGERNRKWHVIINHKLSAEVIK